jgi:hypothetical protein
MSPEKQTKRISRPYSARRNIDLKYFYIRGFVEIPVVGLDQTLVWGAWIQVSKQDYKIQEIIVLQKGIPTSSH